MPFIEFIFFAVSSVLIVPIYLIIKRRALFDLAIAPIPNADFASSEKYVACEDSLDLSLLFKKKHLYGIFFYPSSAFNLLFVFSSIGVSTVSAIAMGSKPAFLFLMSGNFFSYCFLVYYLANRPVLEEFWNNRSYKLENWFIPRFSRVTILTTHLKELSRSRTDTDKYITKKLKLKTYFDNKLLSILCIPLTHLILYTKKVTQCITGCASYTCPYRRFKLHEHNEIDNSYIRIFNLALIDFVDGLSSKRLNLRLTIFVGLLLSPIVSSYVFMTLGVILGFSHAKDEKLLMLPFLFWALLSLITTVLVLQFIYRYPWKIDNSDISLFGTRILLGTKTLGRNQAIASKYFPAIVASFPVIASIFYTFYTGLLKP